MEVPMSRSLRLAVLSALLALTLGSGVVAGDSGAPKLLDSSMVGLPEANLPLYGITGGGVPWTLTRGSAKVYADGRVHVTVDGLVVTATGTNPVPMGHAVLTCSGAFAAATADVPFSPDGDAQVNTTIALPATCLGPAVFFTNPGGRWFAVTGW
jgi:hypothetical protein